MRKQTKKHVNLLVLAAIFLGCLGFVSADEYYAGGVTVDIDYEVFGYLWVEDATVNLYENAHIINDTFFGDIYATSGAVINIYGGTVDGIFLVTTSSDQFSEAEVTIYGTDFAVDGVPVDPAVTEVYLVNQQLSGVYASGTAFSHLVDTSTSGTTVKLAWLVEELTPAEQMEMIIAYYEVAVDDGDIELAQRGKSKGRRQSRKSKHDPFEKMLLVTQRLIDAGYDDYAGQALMMIERKCDGESRPRDLITGDGVLLLNEMINELIDTLTVE